jgi:predicted TPR repeat methyltransferase
MCVDEEIDIRCARAATLASAGEAAAAVQEAEAILEQFPSHVQALRISASCLSVLDRHEDAADAYARLIRLEPGDVMGWIGMAMERIAAGQQIDATTHHTIMTMLGQLPPGLDVAQLKVMLNMNIGRYAAAIAELERAEQAFGGSEPLIASKAMALRLNGDETGAVETLRRWCAAHPTDVKALTNLADHLNDTGAIAAAVEVAEKAAALAPDDAAIASQLGKARLALGDRPGAAAALRRSLELDPSDPLGAAHSLAVAEGRVPAGLAVGTMRATFEEFAGYYDRKMLDRLGYRGPQIISEALDAEVASELSPPWDVLDLGCGTGLVGAALADRARQMVGIDLSPRMLDLARRRQLYDELIEGELIDVLTRRRADRYDVIVAGEVFVYFGDLAPLLAAIRPVLHPGGYLVFNTECAPDEEGDFVPRPSRSFAHSQPYLWRVVARHGFAMRRQIPCSVRTERHRPLDSQLIILRAEEPAA